VVLAAVLAAVACKSLSVDPKEVVALATTLPDSGRVEVNDTIHPRAVALNGDGDSIAATIYWARLDTTVLVVDSLTGATIGLIANQTGRIQARVGNLRSNPITITVLPPLDSLAASGIIVDTVVTATPDSVSDSLTITAFAGTASGPFIAGRKVLLSLVFPTGTPPLTFIPNDTLVTNGSGQATFQVRLTGGPRPDSAVVTAQAFREDGSLVPSTPQPLKFVVVFQ
jgi:hypothetical protein